MVGEGLNYLALLALVGASAFSGTMSQVRKQYQVRNGAGMFSLLMFALVTSILAAVFGLILGKGAFPTDSVTIWISVGYAFICTATSSICLCGSAYGSLPVLLVFAHLGSLILPSLFGVIFFPQENQMSVLRGVGYLLALACMALSFFFEEKVSEEKKRSALIFKILCTVVFFTQGSALIFYKLKATYSAACSDNAFLASYMVFSALMTIPLLLFVAIKNRNTVKQDLKQNLHPMSLLISGGYAILFAISELLALFCNGKIPLMVHSVMSFCLPLIVVVLLDFLIYREKLTKKALIQMGLSILCCLCFLV